MQIHFGLVLWHKNDSERGAKPDKRITFSHRALKYTAIYVYVLQSFGPEYGNPGSGPLACGADLVKQDYNFKLVGQRSGSWVKAG